MNVIVKKLVSGIAMLSMCTSMLGVTVGIASETVASESQVQPLSVTPTINRNLTVEFMGRGATPEAKSPGKARLAAEDVNNEFWVGVAVDKVNDLQLFTNGIYSLEVAFEYDPSFLEPYHTTNDADTEWQTELENGNSTLWDSSKYEIISVRDTDIDTVTDRENLIDAADRETKGWRMCTVCITFRDGVTFENPRFKDLATDEKQYLINLPFRLNNVPADTAVDQNPTVLSLVKGPETLDIGSGEKGKTPYSAWMATVSDWTDEKNMKTLFNPGSDISLFDAGAAIENIEPFKPMTGEETVDTPYTLSETKDLNQEGFKAETLDYYISVPNETEKIKLKITSSEKPEVKANSAAVTTSLKSDKVYETDEIALLELNKDTLNGGEADGFNNTVTVEAGGTTYTVYIRRLLKPKIVLNPGNSPYGLIERMGVKYLGEIDGWSDEKITQAKEAFRDSHSVNKVYGNGLIPEKGNNTLIYTSAAWKSYTDESGEIINYDLNSYSLFVYQGTQFKDPGIEIYDDFGQLVENPNISRVLKVKNQNFDGVSRYTGNDSNDNVTEIDTPLVDGTDDTYTLLGRVIRSDVYFLEYEYTYMDANSNTQTLTAQRPVIVLSRRGDLYLTKTVVINDADSTHLSKNTTSVYRGNSLVAYRSADLVTGGTAVINDADATYLKKNTTLVYRSTNQYYPSLD